MKAYEPDFMHTKEVNVRSGPLISESIEWVECGEGLRGAYLVARKLLENINRATTPALHTACSFIKMQHPLLSLPIMVRRPSRSSSLVRNCARRFSAAESENSNFGDTILRPT
ncbi:uncharacterized protein STEHIDRAFT_123308 [Stereum hirsutum FP-91666 SS1]|uniref:uncharacterized protein n=1 Tax=Stereum hirsutum (strain FP-91666) TaxID=721885 RepID=UPI00044498E6|nr:uncharacterized protein STEHIDRAFT_123308 [Stereum hirsutum FP-91666 SS1]EIM84605.1 hypothetical protein STEHIDRAFT_123308 [Stereum hirsutum FP-91666 SS1]